MVNNLIKILISGFIIYIMSIGYSVASVTMLGNRIIYLEGSQDKTLEFSNTDNTPALVQIWTDINNPKSAPDNADGPFITIPAIFSLPANNKQITKIAYTGKMLATDRETVFYFNYLSIPSVEKTDVDKNKLMFVVSNRLKIFYRPKGLAGNSGDVLNRIEIKRIGNSLKVTNPLPYYASFTSATLIKNKKKHTLEIDMLAPFSTVDWKIPTEYQSGAIEIAFGLINDYGVEKSRKISAP